MGRKAETGQFIGKEAAKPYFVPTPNFEGLYGETLFVPEPIAGDFEGKDILSLNQFTREDLEHIFRITPKMRKICSENSPSRLLGGISVLDLFYAESTRTLQSFQTAAEKLGAGHHPLTEPKRFSSEAKGESFEDTIRTLSRYMDIVVMRHAQIGSMSAAAHLVDIPIINAGEGKDEHPTQGILDLNTIFTEKGRLDNLHGVIAGDLEGSRTTHSLLRGIALFPGNQVTLLALPGQELPEQYVLELARKGLQIGMISRINQIPPNTDYWYWTRPQLERMGEEKVEELQMRMRENPLVVTQNVLDTYAGENTILMHPLPRDSQNNDTPEIMPEVDNDPRAVYLKSQLDHGLWTRMALLGLVAGRITQKNDLQNQTLIF